MSTEVAITRISSSPDVSRRDAIRVGATCLAGLLIDPSLAERASAAVERRRSNAVIYIFLSGGLSQHESFDLKPDAPPEIRSEFRPTRTRTPGVFICEHLPRLAERSEKWALLRSLTHPYNEHPHAHTVMLTGRTPMPPGYDPSKPKVTDWPSIAATLGALLPGQDGLPSAIVLPDKIVHKTGQIIPGQFGGMLGSQRDPWFVEASPYHPQSYGAYPDYLFDHETGKVVDPALVFQLPQLALSAGLSETRVRDRVELRRAMESQRPILAGVSETQQFDRYRDAAFSLLTNDRAHAALDTRGADSRRLDAYGRHSFGKSLLMAAQLVEAGVRFVQVNLGNDETWDTHQSAFPNLKNFLLPPLDQSTSALIDDLEARGLLSSTLIVMVGEFGRTPRISAAPGKLPGRDHWGASQTVFLAGGAVQGGQVIGATDNQGAYPSRSPHTPEDLAATIFQTLGLPQSTAWHDQLQRPHFIYNGEPIAGLC